MMTWNYRVIRKVYDDVETVMLGIHEVFYYGENGGPSLVTMNAIDVSAQEEEGLEGLEQTLNWMLKALRKPILEYSDFEEDGKYYRSNKELIGTSTDGVAGNAPAF